MIFLETLGIFFGKTIAAENSTQTQTKKPKILTKKDPNMKQSIKLKTTILLVIPLALACFALLPRAQAATPENLPAPPPDGFYNGFNTAEGFGALFALTTGTFNTALGFKALNADTSGGSNTAVGGQALLHNNLGNYNTAIGENALVFNTSGSFNMALGQGALATNTGGDNNTAMGFQALNTNTTSGITAVGYQALRNNTTSPRNVAVGFQALFSNTDSPNGSNAFGYQAVQTSNARWNNGFGEFALQNATGQQNNGFGAWALRADTSGANNTAFGSGALIAVDTGNNNIGIGFGAGSTITSADGVIAIGSGVGSNQTNRTFVGNLTNAQIQSFNAGTIKYVTSEVATGRLGVTAVVSSRRYKYDIKPMDKVSEGILALKPATFRVKKEWDTSGLLGFGLIAEDVEEVNPDLVYHNEKGQPESVRYEAVNALLLNEFLKEHKKVEAQQASIAQLKSTVALQQKEMQVLTAQLKEQAAQIQKVSAQVEMSRPAPKEVANQ